MQFCPFCIATNAPVIINVRYRNIPDEGVGIATGYRLDGQGRIPGRGKIFLFVARM
jgi:hypothetical protein